jgi:mRNA-degrading endonuclease YafQ of YafQ-DinJ toxin-antitoxin module
MDKTVQVFKTQIFQNDVNALSFKDNNFTYKQTRSLVNMIKDGLNFSHIIKIEDKAFEKPLFKMHIKGDLYIIFTLEETKPSDYTFTLRRCVRLNDLTEAIETLDTEGVVSPYSFKDFWT